MENVLSFNRILDVLYENERIDTQAEEYTSFGKSFLREDDPGLFFFYHMCYIDL